jgi:hypothetical protein
MNMIRKNDTDVQINRYGKPPKSYQTAQTTVGCQECSIKHEYTTLCSAKMKTAIHLTALSELTL